VIRLKIHPLFLLLLILSGWTGQYRTMLLVFFSVLLHELAHILTAFGFGYRTTAVEFFPFGGVARIDYSLFSDPWAEGITALAGPVQSIIIAMLVKVNQFFFGYHMITGELFQINLGLAFFNFLPLFPLDGGRILRAFLAVRQGYTAATRRAIRLTRFTVIAGMPFSLFLAAKTPAPFYLPLLLLFLYTAAGKENFFYAYWRQKEKKGQTVREKGIMPARIWLVDARRRLGEVLPFIFGRDYHIFLLLDKKGKILGFLKEDELSFPSSENFSISFYRQWQKRKEERGDFCFLSKEKGNLIKPGEKRSNRRPVLKER